MGYFLLTGQHFFEGRNFVEICGHHLHTPPTPPSARLGRPLPAALETRVLACLAKDLGHRPRSALEAASRLEACGLVGERSAGDARAWWAMKGRALATSLRAGATPDAATLSRPGIERAGSRDEPSLHSPFAPHGRRQRPDLQSPTWWSSFQSQITGRARSCS